MAIKNRPRLKRLRRIQQPIRFEPLRPCNDPDCTAKVDATYHPYCGNCRQKRGIPNPNLSRRTETRRDTGPPAAQPGRIRERKPPRHQRHAA